MHGATIQLNEDQLAVRARLTQDIQHAVGALAALTNAKGELLQENAVSCLKLAEFKLAELCKLIGVETDDFDERFAKLRAANGRIRELEARLGAGQGPTVTQASLKVLDKQLNEWWDREGFGHISDIAFGAYGCKVTFSCSLFGNFRLTDSPTPVSDKERRAQWHADLEQRGFVLVDDDRDKALLDCDATRAALFDLVRRRLPSARIIKLDNHSRGQGDSIGFILTSIEMFIRDIEDIAQLGNPA